MHIVNGGEAFILPSCPELQSDTPYAVSDQTAFELHVAEASFGSHAEVFVVFGEPGEEDEYENAVVSECFIVPVDSDTARKTFKIATGLDAAPPLPLFISAEDNPGVAEIRRRICERIAECPCTPDQCKGMGAQALREIIDQID